MFIGRTGNRKWPTAGAVLSSAVRKRDLTANAIWSHRNRAGVHSCGTRSSAVFMCQFAKCFQGFPELPYCIVLLRCCNALKFRLGPQSAHLEPDSLSASRRLNRTQYVSMDAKSGHRVRVPPPGPLRIAVYTHSPAECPRPSLRALAVRRRS
jgi:hypothetical protein